MIDLPRERDFLRFKILRMQRVASWIIAVSPESIRPFWLRLRSSPMAARIARGTFWTVSGAIISRLLGLASSVIMARLLGKTHFGEFSTIQSTIGMFGTFAGLGIGITATKYVAELRERDPARCGRVIGFSLGAALIGGAAAGLGLVLFGGWLAAHTLADTSLAPLLRAGGALVIFSALQGAYLGALAGFEAFKQTAWVIWAGSLAGIPLAIVCTIWLGLMGAVWALILQTAFICVLSHWALRQEMARANIRTSFALSLHEWSMLMRFTLPVFISTMLATQAGWLSRTLLVNQPSGYDQMALISAANSWMNLVNFLPWTMGGVLAPIFANLYATHRRADFLKLLRHNLLLNIGVGLAFALPLMLFASLILRGYGRDFREGVPIFVLTMICGLFITLNNLFSRAMQSAGKAWIDLASNGLWALVVLAGCWPLVHSYQGLGLVGAHTLAALALLIWQWLFVRRLLQNACQRTAPAS